VNFIKKLLSPEGELNRSEHLIYGNLIPILLFFISTFASIKIGVPKDIEGNIFTFISY